MESKIVSAPTIAEAPISLECRVFDVIESGTHDIFLADIVNVSCDDAILDASGRICYEKAGLISYSHGEYFSLGKKIGKFGYSTAKPKRKKPAKQSSIPQKKNNGGLEHSEKRKLGKDKR